MFSMTGKLKGGVFMVFEFFFSAAAGITLGVAVVILPCLYLYQRFIVRGGRR